MKFGRNDPCPCGSGKKYKKCCMGKHAVARINDDVDDDDAIDLKSIPDYGAPKLDAKFFRENPIWENSARMLLCFCMINPGMERAARNFSLSMVSRKYKEERKRIENANSTIELMQLLKSDPDVVNHPELIDKILENPAPAVPMIIEELKHTHSDFFIETSLKILYRSKIDCSDDLIELIKTPVKCAYALSAISMLLGMIGSNNAIKPLWDSFNYLKKYHHERHEQGPLIGFIALMNRGIIPEV
jgi:SEC-C motif